MGGLTPDLGGVEKLSSDNTYTVPSLHVLLMDFFLPALLGSKSYKGDDTLEQVSQRRDGCFIPGNIQGQSGWGSEQPDQVKDVPAHYRGAGLDDC